MNGPAASPRLEKFKSLHLCPVRRGAMRKLKHDDLKMCEQFIVDNDSLEYAPFSAKLNRWFLDQKDKPKNLSTMWAMVSEANSVLFVKRTLK